MPDDGAQGPKNVAFIDDIKSLLCLMVTRVPILKKKTRGPKWQDEINKRVSINIQETKCTICY
jgi:hypothetical protein